MVTTRVRRQGGGYVTGNPSITALIAFQMGGVALINKDRKAGCVFRSGREKKGGLAFGTPGRRANPEARIKSPDTHVVA